MRLVLATICITLLASEAAQAIDCGYAHKRPTGAHVGTAPLAIGDSVMLGAASALAHKGFEVDARCARNPAEGLQLVRQRSRRGTLPEIVVLALGTNIAISTRDIGRMLRTIGHRRTLMLVTPFRSWHPFHTQPMRRVAHRHPKWVKLIDWSARATGNRQWFWSDGTHLRPTGVEVYSRMLKRAAWSRLRGRFG
jgi:hypothetical protein